ncbi:MAG TPA: hypothetical protein VM554_15820 [Acidisarcina sp.]|nr:hypothetical protein [Acidisarcina sp.]
MKRYSNPILFTTIAVALLAQAAGAQNHAKPSPYEGTSQPPANDTIVASPDTPVLQTRRAPAPVAAAAVPTPAPAASVQPAKPAVNPDADIVNDVPRDRVASATPAATLEPSIYERSTNPDADIVHVAPERPGELESGTLLRVRLQQALSTSTTHVGDPFTAIVMAPVSQAGKVIIPMGSEVRGRVVSVHAGKTLRNKPTIRLRPDVVMMPDGSRYMLHAEVLQTESRGLKAGSEGTITTKSQLKKDAVEYGLGTGAGAVVGAEFAGGTGALVGGAIGAGIITVHMLMQNHQAQLPKDSVLIFGLTEPMTFTAVQN